MQWYRLLGMACAATLAAATASAEPATTPGLTWNPRWQRFTPAEYALTGALLAGTGALIVFREEREANWRGPILFDDPARDVLRGSSADLRGNAQIVGDVLYYGGLAYPYVVEVVAIAWLGHDAGDVAGQMALIDTEAFAITGFLSFVSNALIRRERPSLRACREGAPDPIFPGCDDPGPNEGFYSGHTGIAFTSAALTCTHQAHLPLYGRSRAGGVIACAASMTGAAAVGTLRVVADQHYVSDVLAGGAIGLASGFLVPALHYREGAPSSGDGGLGSRLTWFALPLPGAAAIGVSGIF